MGYDTETRGSNAAALVVTVVMVVLLVIVSVAMLGGFYVYTSRARMAEMVAVQAREAEMVARKAQQELELAKMQAEEARAQAEGELASAHSRLETPGVEGAEPTRPVIIVVDETGQATVDKEPRTLGEIREMLSQWADEGTPAAVTIQGHAQCPFESILQLFTTCQEGRAESVELAARSP